MSKITKFSETEIKLLEKVFCPGFSQEDFVARTIVSEEEFLTLVELYNYLLKGNIGEEDSILEMTPAIVKTLFRSYLSEENKGLLFRYQEVYLGNLSGVFLCALRTV